MSHAPAEAATALEARLGHIYRDRDLLRQALTHRSFGSPNNERLEFLGDAFLNALIAKALFELHPEMSEGDLSRLRANLVNQSALAAIAQDLGVGHALRMGEGELKTGGPQRPSILADAVESLIAATFIDAGFATSEALVHRLFASLLTGPQEATATKDPKTALQEWMQGKHLPLPKYSVASIEGAAHQQIFHVNCQLEKPVMLVRGKGATRRAAEQDAAGHALQRLESQAGKEASPGIRSSKGTKQ